MNHIAPRAEPLIREIPLSRLALAPENVRKTPPDGHADAKIKASIAALGQLENLVVRTDGPAADGAERYAVVAGGRRLKAMQALVEDGVLDPDHPVPCLVAADRDTVGELSLAENVVRIAMHPVDQVTAFTNLTTAGLSVSAIAARFGMSERLVEQRLRLGNAAPELLEAYRADAIDLEVLKAFAVTTERERRMAVWEQVSAQGYRPSAWQVKRLLTEERVPGASAIARFVGAKAYEAFGGQALRELFARDDENGVWFEDPLLLEKPGPGSRSHRRPAPELRASCLGGINNDRQWGTERIVIPTLITKSHIAKTIRCINRDGVPSRRRSRGYCLVTKGNTCLRSTRSRWPIKS